MKNLFNTFLYIVLIYFTLLLLVSSCKKYEFNEVLPTIEGTEWILKSGRVYVENLDNGELTYYDHFGPNRTTSNLDIFGGSSTDIDEILENQTSWYFLDGNFILNNNVYYEYTSMGSGSQTQYTIIGVPPFGSSRNIGVVEFNSTILTLMVYESNESHNGVNYHYYTTLTFIKAGSTCSTCITPVVGGYTYGGVVNEVTEAPTNLNGSVWVMTRYDEGLTPYYPQDTLTFLNNVTYTVNGGTPTTYSFSNIGGNNMHHLTLYDFTTLGGNYSGQLSLSFIEAGEINNMTMSGVFGTTGTVQVWLEEI
jgi:hypothetical protein